MNLWVLIGLVFLSVLFLGLGLRFVLFPPAENAKEAMKRRLQGIRSDTSAVGSTQVYQLMRETTYSDIGFLNKVLDRLPNATKYQDLLHQAGDPFNLGTLVLMSGALFGIGLLVGVIIGWGWGSLLAGGILAYIPIVVLGRIKIKRMGLLEEQFPEAVDLMARALRAGHSFGSALQMAAGEIGDPLSTEFTKTFEDYSFGKTMEDALRGLTDRVDLEDVRFFATAVSLQRETGGNLTEILDNIGYIIRERFRIMRTVKALSAEGRLSGTILAVMAPALFGLLYIVSPHYVSMALDHPIGRMTLYVGAIFEVLGVIVIKRLVKLEV